MSLQHWHRKPVEMATRSTTRALRRLFRDLNLARADGSLRQLLKRLNRIDVLVIDDWAMAPMSEAERRDFWEIAEDRYQARSMILTSQLPVSRWHEQIGDPTLADSILDRLVHNAHRIEMRGESMRKQRGEKGEKGTPIGGPKAVEKTGKERPWKSLRDSHFPTASTTTSLTIPITFWKM